VCVCVKKLLEEYFPCRIIMITNNHPDFDESFTTEWPKSLHQEYTPRVE